MHAYELTAPSLSSLRRTTLPDPVPGRGEVLLRLRAATLNYADVAVATGAFPVPRFPIVPVADGAGEVVALGAGVDDVAVGTRAVPHFMPDWLAGPMTPRVTGAMRGVTRQGSLADYVAVPAASLVRTPNHLDDAQAAALPIAATTAWNAVRSAQVRPGSIVVILGTGGVRIFELQLS